MAPTQDSSRPTVLPVAGLVLAGGLSQRMGRDKALIALAGRPLAAHVADRLGPQVARLALNRNAGPGALAALGLPLLPDPLPGHPGPLAGILAGLRWAATLPGITHLATAPTDTPFLPRDLVARLWAQATPGHPVLARSPAGVQPICALWPVALADDLADWLAGDQPRRVQAWAARHAPAFADFDAPPGRPDPFFNANTPADLAQAEATLREAPT